ncbi:MAG: serine hydrolase [Acidobacteriota bacterium]|nr:serine hydrolase [Acidobacteriota bacterium]
MQTTVTDLALWDRNFDKPVVGGPRMIEELTRTFELAGGERVDYGLGLRVDRDGELRRVRHGGSWVGFKAEFLRYPERRISVIVLCNRRDAVASRIARKLAADEIPGLGPEREAAPAASNPNAPAPSPVPSLDEHELRQWAGDFYSEEIDATWRVAAREGGLVLERRGADPEKLSRVSKNVFHSKHVGDVAFEPGPSGGAARFDLAVGTSKIAFRALRR